ncbi:MAG: DUF3084 domain-containing protein [Chroococcidiopsidaceae cyanobacterium CP_BM_ER_R8_30]|nr:DUF3084 domain-containing protein [Chroococcidiopsidaceae cyanobacterium CP_BM_ER_R8_30]
MTTGLILIAAILVLGGFIATVGDRLGTRVGKARLSLFNLRPRSTAVVVTILTGSLIAASTLAILFAVDARLRIGVFELGKIQRDLKQKREQLAITTKQKNQVESQLETTRQQLATTSAQKSQAESELAQAKAEQIKAQKQQAQARKLLAKTNQSLKTALAKQSQTQMQLNGTQTLLSQVSTQFQQAQALLRAVSQQAKVLRIEIQKLQRERQQLIQQRNQVKARIGERDQEIAKLDQAVQNRDRDIAERDKVIAQRAAHLKELESQQDQLESQVARLAQYYQSYKVLRQGNVALLRDQVLAGAVVQIVGPSSARQAVASILQEANRTAIALTQPGTNQVNQQLIELPQWQVDQLINQIDDGRSYVVRVLAAGNYLVGEKHVQVFVSATRNQLLFKAGDVVAATSANPAVMTTEAIQQRLNLLLFAAKFRARSIGLLDDTIWIGDNRIESLFHFIQQLQQYNQPVDIKAIAAVDTYTAGPLKIELVAVQHGKVVFHT